MKCIENLQLKDSISEAEMLSFMRCHFQTAKKNARIRAIEFDITLEHVIALAEREGWRCAISGRRFSFTKLAHWRRRPYAPSIDRIDSTMGYVRGNVRVVCVAINLAINEWGRQVFVELAEAFVAKTRS